MSTSMFFPLQALTYGHPHIWTWVKFLTGSQYLTDSPHTTHTTHSIEGPMKSSHANVSPSRT